MTTPPTEQQLDEITAIAARAADDPFFVSDCEGSLQVWREKALTHVRRDESGVIDMYSFPSTYKVTDQVIELDLGTWDPGEDATDDQQRQDIRDLVEARAAMPALLAEIRRLQTQRKFLLDQLARKDAASGAADVALAALQGSEVPTEPETATETPEGRVGDPGPATPPRRTLTPNEYSAAWHAVEGAAGEEGADPATVLHAVLNRLGIDTPAAEEAAR